MTLADLNTEQFKAVETLTVKYLNELDVASRHGHPHPEGVARQPKVDAYKYMLDIGFEPLEAVEAFREMCGLIDGVTG